jgi:hypothetical protein
MRYPCAACADTGRMDDGTADGGSCLLCDPWAEYEIEEQADRDLALLDQRAEMREKRREPDSERGRKDRRVA